MNASLKIAWQIMLFKKSPEDLPYSTNHLVNITIALLLLSASLSIAAGKPILGIKLALAMLVNAIVLYALLASKNMTNRFLKLFLGYQAVGLIFSLFEIIVLLLVFGQELTPPIFLAVLMLSIWRLSVEGRICQHGFDLSMFMGILLAFFISFMRFVAVSIW